RRSVRSVDRLSGLLLLGLDRVEERVDIVVLAPDEPDHDAFLTLFVPRQYTLDRITIDGDVFVVIDHGCDDGQFDLGVRGLIAQDVDEFARSHGRRLSSGWKRCGVDVTTPRGL